MEKRVQKSSSRYRWRFPVISYLLTYFPVPQTLINRETHLSGVENGDLIPPLFSVEKRSSGDISPKTPTPSARNSSYAVDACNTIRQEYKRCSNRETLQ